MAPGKLYIGTAGWSYADWNGIVYPDGRSKGFHPLRWLAQWFNCVEINSSFYHPPQAKHAVSWVKLVDDIEDFQFAAKLWERFTHHRDSWPTSHEIAQYQEGIAPLVASGRLGALLVQFPWSFRRTPENRVWLGRIAECFEGYPLVVEVRHESWNTPEVFDGLHARAIAFCNIDQPIFQDSIAPSDHVTAPLGYVRFHGRNKANWFKEGVSQNERYDYLYSEEELKPWLGLIQSMQGKAKNVYVVTNNHFHGQAVANALEIQAALGGGRFQLPEHLLAAYPRLRELGQAGNQDG
jgi:uncharacterized protein YecE (DUF72 family)